MKPSIPTCVLHTEASSGWGGQEIRILSEMRGMRQRGHRLLLASPSHTVISRKAAEAGFETFPVSMERWQRAQSIMTLKHIIEAQGVELVNTHSSADSWVGSIASRLAGVKVLRTRHISSALNKGFLTRQVYGRLADEVITTGQFIRNQLIQDLKLDPERVHSIPTGIELERFAGADGVRVRQELGLPENASVLGIAAVLRSWKGHLVLLEAVARVHRTFPEVRLLIVGEGPMRRRIQNRIQELALGEKVLLTGYREDITDVIGCLDVAVMASFASEGIPQFALQAMACAKPIVGTRIGGIPEIIRDGETGFLAEPNDPDSLAHAIENILKDTEAARKMGEAGRHRVSEHHSFQKMLDQLEACYVRVLQRTDSV